MELQKIVKRTKKRLGRGHGSGKVKTSGRGTKGQNARGKVKLGFEGGQLSILKRFPYLRGKGKNDATQQKPFPLPLSSLHVFKDGTTVTYDLLVKSGIVSKDEKRIKILAGKAFSKKLTVTLPCSESAKAAIEKAGGSVQSESSRRAKKV